MDVANRWHHSRSRTCDTLEFEASARNHWAAELEEYGGSEDMGAESAMDGSECALCTQMVRGEAASPGEAGVWPGGCQRSPTGSEQQARWQRTDAHLGPTAWPRWLAAKRLRQARAVPSSRPAPLCLYQARRLIWYHVIYTLIYDI